MIARVTGELDIAAASGTGDRIVAAVPRTARGLVVDFRELEFIDSTGLRLVLRLDAESRQDGFELRLVPGGAAIQRVFELTGTAGMLPFTDA